MLPDRASLLVSRENGGNLVVNPPRPVWERSELTPIELRTVRFLVAAAGRAMIDVLPQLAGGCVNYWEAGNWALNDEAEPKGRKTARAHRQMHLHLLGRSPSSADPAWAWGESPIFPRFADKTSWAASFERLTRRSTGRSSNGPIRCCDQYGVTPIAQTWSRCRRGGYPSAGSSVVPRRKRATVPP